MATVNEISSRTSILKTEIDKCLQRCQNAPYSSYERVTRIRDLQEEANVAVNRIAEELRQLEGPARETAEQVTRELHTKNAQFAELQRQQQDGQRIQQAKQQEYQAKVLSATAQSTNAEAISKQWQVESAQLNEQSAEIGRKLVELQAEINSLQSQQQKAQVRLNEDIARARSAAATEAMLAAEVDLQKLLDKAGSLEREIASGANVELVKQATAAFEGKTGDFSEAERHHKFEARLMFFAMAVVLAVSAGAVYYLFISLVPPPAPADLSEPAALSQHTVSLSPNLERIVVLATGRIAILLFLAWAFKFLAELHKIHSEQAVIYRDRRAALGVAELLLNATPELEQKRDMLRTLADVYLDFDDSAFANRRRRDTTEKSPIDEEIKHVKAAVDAIKPVLDTAGRLMDRTKP